MRGPAGKTAVNPSALLAGLFWFLAAAMPAAGQVLSPSEIPFSSVAGAGPPPNQTVNLSQGTTPRNRSWTASASDPWITITPSSGNIYSEVDLLTVSVDTAGLSAGIRTGTVTVTLRDNRGRVRSTSAIVTLNLASASAGSNPLIALVPTVLNFTGVAGGAVPQPQALSITNPGGGSLATKWVSSEPWLTLSSSSLSTTTEKDTINVTADTSGLAAGTYTGLVTITGNAGNSPQQIPVNVTVQSPTVSQPPPSGSSPEGGSATYRASSDFSNVQGHRGWHYQDSMGRPMTWDPGQSLWTGPDSYLMVWNSGSHPGGAIDAVRRWVAPAAGIVQISGTIRDAHAGCGGGVLATIRKGTKLLWEQVVEEGDTTGHAYSLSTAVSRGDALDFVVNRGGDDNNDCDATRFDPTIVHTSTELSAGNAAVVDNSQSVLLAWSPNRESDLQGYKIYYGTSSRNYTVSIDVGKITSYTVNGLSLGRTYYFALKAVDTAGNQSGYSTESTAVR